MNHTNKPNWDKNAGGKPGTPGDRQGADKNVAGGKQNIGSGGRDQQGRNAGQGQNQSKDQQGRGQGGNAGGNQGRQGNQGYGTGKSGW